MYWGDHIHQTFEILYSETMPIRIKRLKLYNVSMAKHQTQVTPSLPTGATPAAARGQEREPEEAAAQGGLGDGRHRRQDRERLAGKTDIQVFSYFQHYWWPKW